MKIAKLLIIIAICFSYATLFAEDDKKESGKKNQRLKVDSIFGDTYLNHGGYGGPVTRFGQIGDDYGLFVGGRGGWIINHNFVLGGAGYGHVAYNMSRTINGVSEKVYMGYGGVMLEYFFFPSNLIHFSVGAVIGGGGIRYGGTDKFDEDHNMDHFFAVEPEINVFLNITSFFKVGLGGSYRYIKGISTDGVSDSDYRGFSAQLVLAFGFF